MRDQGGDLMVTQVHGGDSAFVVPSRAECLVERRTAPGESAEQALAGIRALITREKAATADLEAHRPPWRLDADLPAADLAVALGADLTFDASYWMEAPLWQAVCPTVICGPTGGGMHAIDEWVDLRQVRAFARALTETLPAWAQAYAD